MEATISAYAMDYESYITLSTYPYISYQLFILSLVQNVGDIALIWEGYHSHLSTAHSLFSSYGSSFNRLV